jgi:CheY-like chemotaxis protein
MEMLTHKKVDLILLDMLMPEFNGLDFLEFLDKKFPSIPPVIVCSSIAERSIVQSALALGASAYLPKPIDKAKLKKFVCDFLGLALPVDFTLPDPAPAPKPIPLSKLELKKNLKDVSLRRVMAAMVYQRQSGVVEVFTASGISGLLSYTNGKLISISFMNRTGLDALELLSLATIRQIQTQTSV